MANSTTLADRYGPEVAALQESLAAGDEAAFRRNFEGLRDRLAVDLLPELRRATETAQSALRRFREETRFDALATSDVPDARRRLVHVEQLTSDAAHRTLDLVERSGPLIDQSVREAERLVEEWNAYGHRQRAAQSQWPERALTFIAKAREDADQVRKHLTEMLLAQGYQDLTGQILRGVIALVDDLELVLAELMRICDGGAAAEGRNPPTPRDARATTNGSGHGPHVPGISDGTVVGGQDDIDAILSSMAGNS